MSTAYEVLIVGAGPAGLTAGMYSSWLGLKTLILESGIIGGRAWLAPKIENFPGFENGIKGNILVDKMTQQASRLGAEIKDNEEAVGINIKSEIKSVVSRRQRYETSAIIIATGTQRRKLRVPGEAEFLGRGVSYCAICDGPFFKNKTVAIVGNREEAAIDALYLADLAKKVLLVSHGTELKIEGALMDRLQSKSNTQIVKGRVIKITGNKMVKAITILEEPSQREAEKEVNAVFVSLGGVPLTEVVNKAGINTDRNGCLTVDRQQRTNLEGVFAAGDCTCGGMQVITAAGEGAMAAMRASSYTKRKST